MLLLLLLIFAISAVEVAIDIAVAEGFGSSTYDAKNSGGKIILK